MGRAKASMELISNKKSRRVTFEKRRKGLEKKAHELSTLCGVKVALIIYGPKDTNNPPMELNIWPQDNPQDILSLINSYKQENLTDRCRRTTDLTMFFRERRKKAEEELARLQKKNAEAKQPTWDEHYDSLTSLELRQFGGLLESKLEAMRARLHFMKGTQTYFAHSASSAADGPSGITGSIDQHNSQIDSQDHQNPYAVQSLFKRSRMQLEIIQQQQLAAFTLQTQQCSGEMPFHMSFNSLPNPKTTMLMNDGSATNGSSMYSSSNNSLGLVTYKQPMQEHVVGTKVEAPLHYYLPAMHSVPIYTLHNNSPRISPMGEYYHQM